MKYLIKPILRLLWFILVTAWIIISVSLRLVQSLLLSLWHIDWYFEVEDFTETGILLLDKDYIIRVPHKNLYFSQRYKNYQYLKPEYQGL